MAKLYSFLCFTMLVGGPMFSGYSQVNQIKRVEFEKKDDGYYYNLVSAGEKGILYIRDLDESKKGEDMWNVLVLDTLLEEQCSVDLSIDYNFKFKGYEYFNGHLYLLFDNGLVAKNKFHIIKVNVDDGEVETYDIDNSIQLQLSHFLITGNAFIFAGYIRSRPSVVFYDAIEEKVTMIPGFFNRKSEIVEMMADPVSDQFAILQTEKGILDNEWYLRLRSFDNTGNLLFEKKTRLDDDVRIFSGKIYYSWDRDIIVTGTFGGTASNHYTNGIFFSRVDEETELEVLFHYYSDMENFLDFMSPRRAEKIKNKIVEKEIQGKQYKINSRLLLHEIIEGEDRFLLLAEVYDPEYDEVRYWNYGDPYFQSLPLRSRYFYAPQVNRVARVEDSNTFEYIQAVVVALDTEGNLMWDNNFQIEEVETPDLHQVVDFNAKPHQVEMLYHFEDKLSYKVIDADSTLLEKYDEPIAGLKEDDKFKHQYDDAGETMYWYDDYFFIWGYQRIENRRDQEVDPSRKVVYISKLSFQ